MPRKDHEDKRATKKAKKMLKESKRGVERLLKAHDPHKRFKTEDDDDVDERENQPTR